MEKLTDSICTTRENKSSAFQSYDLPKVDLLDRLINLIYVPIFLVVLLSLDPLQRVARILGKRPAHKKVIEWMNASFVRILGITRTKIDVQNYHKLDPDKSYIIISNHQSMYDMPLISTLFKSHFPRFIAKIEMSKGLPAISYNLKHCGHALIDRSNPRQALPEIKRFAKMIEREKSLAVIFPEGTRARRGALREFKKRGALTLLKYASDAEVIPLTFENTWKLSSRMTLLMPRNSNVKIIIGEPISRENKANEEILEEAFQTIKTNLESLRQS